MSASLTRVRTGTRSDLRIIVKIHRENFSTAKNVRLGYFYNFKLFEKYICDPRGLCLVLLKDDEIIGYLIAAPTGLESILDRELLVSAAISVALHPWALFDRKILAQIARRLIPAVRNRLSRTSPPTSTDTFGLVALSISKPWRKHGYGRQLIARFEEEAFRRGHHHLVLSVEESNQSARKFYESKNWVLDQAASRTPSLQYFKILDADASLKLQQPVA